VELNPVAAGALKKVPVPEELDFDTPINSDLHRILQRADEDMNADNITDSDFEVFYNHRIEPSAAAAPRAAAERLDTYELPGSYQQTPAATQLDAAKETMKRKERRDRNKDDPFYIADPGNESTASSSLRNIIKSSNGENLDIDSIPIMNLSLDATGSNTGSRNRTPDMEHQKEQQYRRAVRKRVQIIGDETIDASDETTLSSSPSSRPLPSRAKKSVLVVDSSGLGSLSLDNDGNGRSQKLDIEQRQEEERALKEVERLRLEMQRASERIIAKEEAVVVKRKKKITKNKQVVVTDDEGGGAMEAGYYGVEDGGVVKRRKKVKKKDMEGGIDENKNGEGEDNSVPTTTTTKRKKKKRRVVGMEEPTVAVVEP
jgi:AP-3 complex subunit delta-1